MFYVLIPLASVIINSACENFHNVDRDLGGGTMSFYEKDISPNIGWSIDRGTKVQIIYKYLFIRISDILIFTIEPLKSIFESLSKTAEIKSMKTQRFSCANKL